MPPKRASRETTQPFRPRARLLRLLGDQLIRDAGIAVFELVKNGYDADASLVTVTLESLDTADARIVVEDNGTGMTYEVVTGAWLEPGTDYRKPPTHAGHVRTPIHHRVPLGEKGVGRFAAAKLGDELTLITRSPGRDEVVVSINWPVMAEEDYLDQANVTVLERVPEHFLGKATGTRLEVRGLHEEWDRRTVRALRRSMTSICSPFTGPDDFETDLVLDPDPGWLDGLPDVGEMLEQALFKATGTIHGSKVTFNYQFTPLPGMRRLEPRSISRTFELQRASKERPRIDLGDFAIGEVPFELLIFDREPQVLALGVGDKAGLKSFLDQNGGVRVYRDGIRVYDYGEPGDDWLSLDARRVNVPSQRVSNNIVVGAVSLDRDTSTDLVEKTNREGFVEDAAFESFRDAVQFTIQQVAVERNADKNRIRSVYSKKGQRRPVLDSLDDLRSRLSRKELLEELGPQVDAVERDYIEMRDQLLTAAGAGLSLSVVVHEVDKAILDLNRALERDAGVDQVRTLAHHLAELVTGLTYLVRRSGSKKEKASALVTQALFNVDYRLRHHGITVTNAFSPDADFSIRCVRRLIIATLMNLIDNSIWWLDVAQPQQKRLWVGPTSDLERPAIVVADNGTGFVDPPEMLVQPFMSRRTEGMGLGLHLASEVMTAQGGALSFPEPGDLHLPRDMDGAVVAMEFGGTS